MAQTASPPVVLELQGRVKKLRALEDKLRQGEIFRKAIIKAQDPLTWQCPPGVAMVAWLQHMDRWMAHHLVEAIELVAFAMDKQARAIEKWAQDRLLDPSVPAPPPLGPVKNTVSTPPEFKLEVGPANSPIALYPDKVRELAQLIGESSGEVMKFAAEVERELPMLAPVVDPITGLPPLHNPPPDALQAVGHPVIYQTLAQQIGRAAQDANFRAQEWEKLNAAMSSSAPDVCLPPTSGADVLDAASDAAAVSGDNLQQPAEPPPPAEEKYPDVPQKPIDEQIRAADEVLKEYPPKKVLEDPKKLVELTKKLDENKGQEAFAARFLDKFGADNFVKVPRVIQAWQHHRISVAGIPTDPEVALRSDRVDPPPEEGQGEGILYSWSATLATATQNVAPNKDEREEMMRVANAKDPLALSWLLSDPKAEFSPQFLVESFELVEQAIFNEAQLSEKARQYTNPILGADGEPLSPDLKVGILDAISRSPDALKIITDPSFSGFNDETGKEKGKSFFPVTLRFQLGGPVTVRDVTALLQQGKYDDKGEALGRMLDKAHQALQGDPNNTPDSLATRIVDGAVKNIDPRVDLSGMTESFRQIGLREHPTDEEAKAALDKVKKDHDHPARELLLAEASRSGAVAQKFVEDAAKPGAKNEQLFETRAAWDIVKQAQNSLDATGRARADAETTVDETIRAIASGKDMDDRARRGFADVLSAHVTDMSVILAAREDEETAAADKGLGVTADQLRAMLKDLAKDKEAIGKLMTTVGVQVTGSYASAAEALNYNFPTRPEGMPESAWRAQIAGAASNAGTAHEQQHERIGEMFCEMADAVRQAGIDKREAAAAMLAHYRLGVDIAFGLIDKMPGIGQAKAAAEAVAGYVPNTNVSGFEDKLKDDVAGLISGIDTGAISAETKSDSKNARDLLDRMVTENMMTAMAKQPELLFRLEVVLPDEMLVNPGTPMPPPVGTPPRMPDNYIKPEFLTPEGTVKIPGPGSPQYESFTDWYMKDADGYNPLYQAASNASTGVRKHMKDCMMDKLWDEAS